MQLDIRYISRQDREKRQSKTDESRLQSRYEDLIERRDKGYEWAKKNPQRAHGPGTPDSPSGLRGEDQGSGAIFLPSETAECHGGGERAQSIIPSPPSREAARGGGLAGVGHTPRPAPPFEFDGLTYDSRQDKERLATALGRVWDLMRDGEWRSLAEVASQVGCSEAGASARLRDLRKKKFSAVLPTVRVQARRAVGGLWVYRVDVPQEWRR